MGVPRGELRHHVDERDVEEDARGGCEHPGGEVVEVAKGKPEQHADEG